MPGSTGAALNPGFSGAGLASVSTGVGLVPATAMSGLEHESKGTSVKAGAMGPVWHWGRPGALVFRVQLSTATGLELRARPGS